MALYNNSKTAFKAAQQPQSAQGKPSQPSSKCHPPAKSSVQPCKRATRPSIVTRMRENHVCHAAYQAFKIPRPPMIKPASLIYECRGTIESFLCTDFKSLVKPVRTFTKPVLRSPSAVQWQCGSASAPPGASPQPRPCLSRGSGPRTPPFGSASRSCACAAGRSGRRP